VSSGAYSRDPLTPLRERFRLMALHGVDGSFVTEMLNSKMDRAMIEMIVHVAKVMGKRTIAEFVENDEILPALREIGVDYAQGYAIGKPSPFKDMYPLPADAPHREVA